MTDEVRIFAPAAARNREPIAQVLLPLLPKQGLVLEVASGSGEHVVHLAGQAGNGVIFQPSDPDGEARASIDAWVAYEGVRNVQPALALDATAQVWPITQADVVVCINMIHISPWESGMGLLRGAGRILPAGGLLYLYGPYKRGGAHTSQGNVDFDAQLRAQDERWGIRNVEDVAAEAARSGFDVPEIVDMPANNLSLVFRRAG